MRPDLHKLQQFRERLVQIRLDICKKRKSPPWSKHDLCVVLKSLKKNACRDPHGWINEIFNPDICGDDVVNALLVFYNKLKNENTIPQFLQVANISCICKGKGNKMDPKMTLEFVL